MQFPYFFAWGSPRGKQAGQWFNEMRESLYRRPCRVLCRGRLNSCMIAFEDGTRHVVSRNALRRQKPQPPTSGATALLCALSLIATFLLCGYSSSSPWSPGSSSSVSGALGAPGGGGFGGSVGPGGPFPLVSSSVAMGFPQSIRDECKAYVDKLFGLEQRNKMDSLLAVLARPVPCRMDGADLRRRLWTSLARSKALLYAGRYQDVIALADSVLHHWTVQLAFEEEAVPLLIERRGLAHYHLKHYRSAADDLARALAHWPRLDHTRAELSANLAWSLLRIGKTGEAYCRFIQTQRVIGKSARTAHNDTVNVNTARGLVIVAERAGVIPDGYCRGVVYNDGQARVGITGRAAWAVAILLFATGAFSLGGRYALRRRSSNAPEGVSHAPEHSDAWKRATGE